METEGSRTMCSGGVGGSGWATISAAAAAALTATAAALTSDGLGSCTTFSSSSSSSSLAFVAKERCSENLRKKWSQLANDPKRYFPHTE
jgi:hypothetical protein